VNLVHDDLKPQVGAGFTAIVYWDDIRGSCQPANFKISPVAVIERGGAGVIILDLSFPVRNAEAS
jgi:hypothetical protein